MISVPTEPSTSSLSHHPRSKSPFSIPQPPRPTPSSTKKCTPNTTPTPPTRWPQPTTRTTPHTPTLTTTTTATIRQPGPKPKPPSSSPSAISRIHRVRSRTRKSGVWTRSCKSMLGGRIVILWMRWCVGVLFSTIVCCFFLIRCYMMWWISVCLERRLGKAILI